MTDTAIQVEGLSKRYRLGATQGLSSRLTTLAKGRLPRRDDFWALEDVSFDVPRGEVLGVIGGNGAGKSTLLKILSRITDPTEGRAVVRGRVGSLLEVGTGFHPELTGKENIYLSGAVLGMSRAEVKRQFDEIVDFAGIEKFLQTPVKRYSSGMYVRLAFAVAAHLQPEVLIVDEVLAVGDASFQARCLGRMGEVAKSGRTVLFVSHNMDAIRQLCTRAIHLREGRAVEQSEDVAGVVGRYFAASLQHREGEWTPSGETPLRSKFFTPTRFRLVDPAGRTLDAPVSRCDTAFVEIEGEVLHNAEDFTAGFAVSSERGEMAFWSCFTDLPRDRRPALQPGSNTLRVELPLQWLNEGRYFLELCVKLPGREWLCKPQSNAPAIALDVKGGLSESERFTRRRSGLLAPLLEWETDSPAQRRGEAPARAA